MPTPTLTVISGPPGAGKTTVALGLAERLGRPAICRDAIKEGMVDSVAGPGVPIDHDGLNLRTLDAFFAVLGVLIRAEVSTIAEAAFQDRLWRPGLTPLLGLARVLLIRCRIDTEVARTRQQARLGADPRRIAHADQAHLDQLSRGEPASFDWPRLDVPTLDLTTDVPPAVVVDVAAEFVLTQGGSR